MTAAAPEPLSISAIICTRGRPQLLGDCLASVAAGLGTGDELIVVESGSTEARATLEGLPNLVARPVYLHVDQPGKCRQLNLGIREAGGDVLLLTDDDVRVQPTWPRAMAACFADPAVGIACGVVHGLSRAPGLRPGDPVPAGEAPFETWSFAHGAGMAVRATAAWEAGGFDERLGPGTQTVGEDHDFLLRVRERGWRVMVADAPPAEHLDWRNDRENLRNALAYERGYGAVVSAAMRRSSAERWRLLKSRLGYQRQILRGNPRFGSRALWSFAGGFAYGLRLNQRDWLGPR